MPNCHQFKECGTFFIGNNNNDHFIEDSPDGLVVCNRQCKEQRCRNILEYPCGKLSVEIKCPYSPLSNRTLLPVSYTLPTYYACQVLTHMKATDTNILLFASCSKESVAVLFVDFQPMMWQSLYNYADELYGEKTRQNLPKFSPCHWN